MNMFGKAISDLQRGIDLHHVWIYQAYHEISAKYKRTALGSIWIAGGFIVTSFSFGILFGELFHLPLATSLPYTMAGILVFGLVSFVFFEGAEIFISSSGIIRNHAYPFTFYVFQSVCKNFFVFLHNLIVFLLVTLIIGAVKIPHWSILLAIPLLLIFMFSWGMLSTMISSRFRDMRFMLPYIGQLFSVLTPIFWRPDSLQGTFKTIIMLNPVYSLIQIVRQPLLGEAATPLEWGLAATYTFIGVVLWAAFFSGFRRRIPFWV
jgi:ABC-type polysaccharide/polyol phosphate export permease